MRALFLYQTREPLLHSGWINIRRQSSNAERRPESGKKFLQLKTYNFKKAWAKCSKVLYQEKRIGWRKFVESKTPTSEIWSLIRAFKRRNLTLPKYIADPFKERQSIQEVIQKLCPPSYFQDNSTSLEEMKREDGNSGVVFEEIDSSL